MLKNIWILGFCFVLSLSANAGLVKDSIVPYFSKFFGEEKVAKFFGVEFVEDVKMPAIPEVFQEKTEQRDLFEKESTLSKKEKEKFDYFYLKELYRMVINREVKDRELIKWRTVMIQGATREGVYRALVSDNTYKRLENYGATLNSDAIEFATFFLDKYLARRVAPENFEKINLYHLKKMVTDMSLDVIDVYLANKESDKLYRWYGNFSSDLAKKGEGIWKNKIRKDSKKIRHYLWAKEVPTQHLKSEVIIKINQYFNTYLSK